MTAPWTPPVLLDTPARVVISPQQARVLSLICRGRTNRQIARELIVTVDTAKTHVSRLYRLLGVQHRAHAVAVAMGGQTQISVRVDPFSRKEAA